MGVAWPLVGRRAEVKFVADALDRDGLVVLAGEGVGETRLLAELAGAAIADGGTVVQVTGSRAARGIPLAAFAHVLPPLAEGTSREATYPPSSKNPPMIPSWSPLKLPLLTPARCPPLAPTSAATSVPASPSPSSESPSPRQPQAPPPRLTIFGQRR